MTEVEDRTGKPESAAGGVDAFSATENLADLPTDEMVKQFHVHHPGLADLDSRHRVMETLRRECPVGRSEVFGGYWVVTGYANQEAALKKADVFTSQIIIMPPLDARDSFIALPIMKDGAEHREYRRLLDNAFTRRRVARLEPDLRQYTRELAREFAAAEGPYDFLGRFATPVPAFGFLRILGFPAEDLSRLLEFRDWLLKEQFSEDEAAREHFQRVLAPQFVGYVEGQVTARENRATAPDDLLTKIVHSTVFGRRVTVDEICRMLGLIIAAGLDTTAASIAQHMEWFAAHQDRWRELIDHPDRITNAIEEMLRWNSFCSPARLVASDVELGGHTIKAGDLIQMPLAGANFDPEANPDPERVEFERARVRHLTFGTGPHFCLGAGLARLALQISYEELTKAVPRFKIAEGTTPLHHTGNVMGVTSMELEVVRARP
jgi:cytochrome P450